MIIKALQVGNIGTNCYLVKTGNTLYIIDPGADGKEIFSVIKQENLLSENCEVLFTHAHADHIGAAGQLSELLDISAFRLHPEDCGIYSSPDNGFPPFIPVAENLPQTVPYPDAPGDYDVLPTPGHSPGSVCLKFGELLFSGDTLFRSSIGRSDLPGGNYQILINSISSVLLPLPDETIIFPGHGENTTLADEKKFNPYL